MVSVGHTLNNGRTCDRGDVAAKLDKVEEQEGLCIVDKDDIWDAANGGRNIEGFEDMGDMGDMGGIIPSEDAIAPVTACPFSTPSCLILMRVPSLVLPFASALRFRTNGCKRGYA